MGERTGDPLDDESRGGRSGDPQRDEGAGDDPPADRAGLGATSGDADPPGGTTDATDAAPEAIRHAEDGAGVGEGRQE